VNRNPSHARSLVITLQGLWRSNDPEVMNRFNEVKRFYTTSDPRSAEDVLRRYHVTHVVVGDLERSTYPGAERVEAFPFLQKIHPGATSVYRVATIPLECS
jgi:uncharacterized membrane protein